VTTGKENRSFLQITPKGIYYKNDLTFCFISSFGRPGVEFTGQQEDEVLIRKLLFLPGQGRIVSLTEDNNLHLWEINGTKLEVSVSAFRSFALQRNR
jgi:hypothetical protein